MWNDNQWLESLKELGSADSCPGVHRQLQVTNLLINLLHEVNDEIDEFVFKHLLRVEVCYQKTDVISLQEKPVSLRIEERPTEMEEVMLLMTSEVQSYLD